MCPGAVPWAASWLRGRLGGEVELPPARPDGPALLAGEAPRRTRIAFSAVVTISASSTTISDPAEVRVSTHRRVAAGVLAMLAAPIVYSRLPISGPARYDTGRGLPGPHRSDCAADG